MNKFVVAKTVIVILYIIFEAPRIFSLPTLNEYDIWSEETSTPSSVEYFKNNIENKRNDSSTLERTPKVLNFFPVPVEEECVSRDRRRKGVCLNAYECRIQGGSHHGPCALGFGVCCVFTATCGEEAINNLTYFVNPDFPDLSTGMTNCSLQVKKIDPEIAQLRLDFIHFNLGQPNRRTGVCEDDVFILSGGVSKELRICGLNNGQHVYYDIENIDTPLQITMTLSKRIVSRIWEVRIIQVPFTERAPAGCLQYHTGAKGVIQTMNFADNGRHLADQDYNICMRQEDGMCTIAYEPCDENSFRIGANNGGQTSSNAEMMGSVTNPDNNMMGNDPNQMNPSDDPPQELGSGAGGMMESRQMEICSDRIVMPCDSEDLIMPGEVGTGFCSLAHCGNSFCPMGERPCRIESSYTPFTIGVHFGPNAREAPADDNIGMCLQYEQLPCAV